MQLMDNNLIVPGGAIVADNTLMKVQLRSLCTCNTCQFIKQLVRHVRGATAATADSAAAYAPGPAIHRPEG
jgi:hypothetical protein